MLTTLETLAIVLADRSDRFTPDNTVLNFDAGTDAILDVVKQLAFFAAAMIASPFIRLRPYMLAIFPYTIALTHDPLILAFIFAA